MARTGRFMPPALAKLFSGTSLSSSAAPATRGADSDEDEDEGGEPAKPAALSDADAQRIAANAETAVTQAIEATNKRWADVMSATFGEGDAKASIISHPARAAAAVDLLSETDLAADKIVAMVSKDHFAGPAAQGDAHAIAAAAARERARGTHQPETGASGTGGTSGGDGTGTGGKRTGRPESVRKTAQDRNATVEARATGGARPRVGGAKAAPIAPPAQ